MEPKHERRKSTDPQTRTAVALGASGPVTATVAAWACLLAIAGLLVAASPAAAVVPSELCTGNPCAVFGAWTLPAGTRLDFGAETALRLKPGATLTVGPGRGVRSLSLVAGSIVLEPGARILGAGDDAAVGLVALRGDVDLQAAGTSAARILVDAAASPTGSGSAGSIDIEATGSILVSGVLDASATGEDSTGGTIELIAGGSVSLLRDVAFGASGPGSWGGTFAVEAGGPVSITGALLGPGTGQGGEVTISSLAAVALSKRVDLAGGAPDGAGGALSLVADGDVSLAQVTAGGGSGSDGSCGDGGVVTIDAAGAIALGGPLQLPGGSDCSGGSLAATAGKTFTQSSAASLVATGGWSGGEVEIRAAGATTLRNFDLSGRDGGGSFDVLATEGAIELQGVVDATGSGTDGTPGAIVVQGCQVSVAATSRLLATGDFHLEPYGRIRLVAGGPLVVAGILRAEWSNELVVRSGSPTFGVGSQVSPAPTTRVDPVLPSCVQLAVCGDGVLDPGEACDDGGNAPCDGCSSTCDRVDAVCGDGTPECGEACDDGNSLDGDGCTSDCRLPGAATNRWVGSTVNHGCFAQWILSAEDLRTNDKTGFPALDQWCIDGDERCDRDGRNDMTCSFEARICVRGDDPRLAECRATVAPIADVVVRSPSALSGGSAVDRANTSAIAAALGALGGTVRVGSTTVRSGPPIETFETCTAPFRISVPRTAAAQRYEMFNLGAHDVRGATMDSVRMRLHCLPNDSVCGNGVLEVTETCDDGNRIDCDGCSARCRVERCGDGVVQCGEECDAGAANGPGGPCTSECTEPAPSLRIPGGGTRGLDCGHEFAAKLDPGRIRTDPTGVPRPDQDCVDGNPLCDLDPAPGSCTFRLWSCVGGSDDRLACPAAAIDSWQVVEPKSRSTGRHLDARNALLRALEALPSPAGPGEICTPPYEVAVPVAGKGIRLKPKVRYSDLPNADADTIRLRCLPSATP